MPCGREAIVAGMHKGRETLTSELEVMNVSRRCSRAQSVRRDSASFCCASKISWTYGRACRKIHVLEHLPAKANFPLNTIGLREL